jgi:hypothetical protein
MKYLTLLPLLIPLAFCTKYTYNVQHCYCASSTKVGWVRTHSLLDKQGRNTHSFSAQASYPRRDDNTSSIIGLRCSKQNTTMDSSLKIPKILYYPELNTISEYSINDNCNQFDDGLRFSGGEYEMNRNGKSKKYKMKDMTTKMRLECSNQCKNDWVGIADAFDICAYTDRKMFSDGHTNGRLRAQSEVENPMLGRNRWPLKGCCDRTAVKMK